MPFLDRDEARDVIRRTVLDQFQALEKSQAVTQDLNIVWCVGPPGIGKTTLCQRIPEELRQSDLPLEAEKVQSISARAHSCTIHFHDHLEPTVDVLEAERRPSLTVGVRVAATALTHPGCRPNCRLPPGICWSFRQ